MKIKIIHSKILELSDSDMDILKEFIKFCIRDLKITSDVRVRFLKMDHDVEGISTGGFCTQSKEICVRFGGRSLLDSMRTLSHELVHLQQKDSGEMDKMDKIPDIGGKIEDDANSKAERLMCHFIKDTGVEWIYNY
jgi:hypothetical protein